MQVRRQLQILSREWTFSLLVGFSCAQIMESSPDERFANTWRETGLCEGIVRDVGLVAHFPCSIVLLLCSVQHGVKLVQYRPFLSVHCVYCSMLQSVA